MAVDHFEFSNAVSNGKHRQVTLPEAASAPSTGADETALYAKEAQSTTQMFMRRESNGSEIQLTASDVTDANAQNANGYSCLPGGLLIQWGSFSASSSSVNVNFPKAFSATPYVVQTTQNSTSTSSTQNANVDDITASKFTAYRSSSTTRTYFFTAIGPA